MRLMIEHRLKCGCMLKHSAIDDDFADGKDDVIVKRSLMNLAELVSYWLEVRTRDHDCALVSEDNPAGNRRQYEREQRKGN